MTDAISSKNQLSQLQAFAEEAMRYAGYAEISDWQKVDDALLREGLAKTLSILRGAYETTADASIVDALQDSMRAIDDWLNTYASDECDDARVTEANERIRDYGGTLAYIASVQAANRRALRSVNSCSHCGGTGKSNTPPDDPNDCSFCEGTGKSAKGRDAGRVAHPAPRQVEAPVPCDSGVTPEVLAAHGGATESAQKSVAEPSSRIEKQDPIV